MPLRAKRALLTNAPEGGNFCQFDSDHEPLAESVALFAANGLERGEAVILVVPPQRAEDVLAHLTHQRLDPAAARESGHLVLLDPVAALAECSPAGVPDFELLKLRAVQTLERLPSNRCGNVRLYGEMVDLLWQVGRPDLAMELEAYWAGFTEAYRLCIFCGFTFDPLAESTYTTPFGEIGRLHASVLPTKEDDLLLAAVDAATFDVLGISFSTILKGSVREQSPGEHRLPMGRRTILWLHRNMPVTSTHILKRARHYMEQGAPAA